MIWLGIYLKWNQYKGELLIPKKGKDLEVYVDAAFYGNWDKDEPLVRDKSQSRHSYIMMYAIFPVVQKSQFHSDITL